ncbi:hypothetical protein IJJ37_02730, partial [Candidatus Saccharibacteria bacterium]|nr:hypothetical protein [Candidatus Saccharibacteria bacterium]
YKSNNSITSNNTTTFFPSPSSTNTITMDETSTANASSAKSYTIGLGVRADYTKTAGTYNNTNSGNTLTLAYVANPSNYSITYNKGNTNDTVSNMPYASANPANVQAGEVSATSITLSNTIPTRTGYDFKGWCTVLPTTTNNNDTCTGTIYNPDGNGTNLSYGIDRTTNSNTATLYAMWNIKTYSCFIQSRDQNADGSYGSYTTRVNSTVQYGGSCSWSVAATTSHQAASYTNNNVTSNVNQSLNVDRQVYYIYYDANGGTNGPSTQSFLYGSGDTISTATPTPPTGYHFSYWYGQGYGDLAPGDSIPAGWSSNTLTAIYAINTYIVDINPVINDTLYSSGLSGFTFDVYLNGSLVADDVTDYYNGTVDYGTTIRVIANGVSGYNVTDSADVSYTVTSGLDIRPTWTDNVWPTHTNWWWGSVTTDVAYLYIQAYDVSGVQTVQCPTSTASGGYSNWYWFSAVWDSGANAWRCDITPATFGHYGQTYVTHLYMYDARGNGGYYNQTSVNIPTPAPGYCTDTATCMQTYAFSSCPTGGTTLTDARDGNTYSVKKIGSLCWMTSNLKTMGTVTAALSNFSGSDFNIAGGGSLASGDTYTAARATLSINASYPGAYYNYCAASAGTICTNSNSAEASFDICPSGWRLPTNSEFGTIGTSSGSATNVSAFGAVYSGDYENGRLYNTGSNGYWWSSTAYDTTYRYILYYGGSGKLVSDGGLQRIYGLSIRCVKSS